MVEQKIEEFTDSTLFPQDWNEKSLDEISIIDSENLPSNTPNEYLFNYIAIDDIQKGLLKKWSLIKFKNAPSRARKKIQFNDILLSTVRPNLQSHFLMDRHDADFVCSTGFSVIRCHNKIDPKSSTESIRASYGYGIKFYSPIGPIGFSWAFPIQDEEYDIKRKLALEYGKKYKVQFNKVNIAKKILEIFYSK